MGKEGIVLARYITDDPSSQEDIRLAILTKAGDESAL